MALFNPRKNARRGYRERQLRRQNRHQSVLENASMEEAKMDPKSNTIADAIIRIGTFFLVVCVLLGAGAFYLGNRAMSGGTTFFAANPDVPNRTTAADLSDTADSTAPGWKLEADTGHVDNEGYFKPNEAIQMTDRENKVWYTHSSETAWQTVHFVIDVNHSLVIDSYTIVQDGNELTGGYIGVIKGPAEASFDIYNGAAQVVAIDGVQTLLNTNIFTKFCRGDRLANGDWSYQPWALSHQQLSGYTFPNFPSSCPKASTSSSQQPTGTTISGQRQETGVGNSLPFTSGTPVIGYLINLENGDVFQSCYLANPASDGMLTDGVLFPDKEEIAAAVACK